MSFGSPKPQPTTTTQVNKVELSPEQKKLFDLVYPTIQANAQAPTLPDNLVPGFDPLQQAAQAGLLESVQSGAIGQGVANAGDASNFLLSGNLSDPSSNPHLQSALDTGTQFLKDTFLEEVLPSIRGGAIESGQLGGSRQGVAEGIASGKFGNSIANVTSSILNNAFNTGVDAQGKALALAPQTNTLQASPYTIEEAIGGQRRGLEQDKAQYELFKSMFPLEHAKGILGLMSGLPGGSGTSTVTGASPQQPGAFASGLGGAASGLSLASMLPAAFGINPLLGAGLGALAGVLTR